MLDGLHQNDYLCQCLSDYLYYPYLIYLSQAKPDRSSVSFALDCGCSSKSISMIPDIRGTTPRTVRQAYWNRVSDKGTEYIMGYTMYGKGGDIPKEKRGLHETR